jgi:ferrochelatase
MKGVLLVNLGTPDEPTPAAVGAYLSEFLSDPRVVDLPRWFWLPLLKLVIVPLRRYRSAEAYKKVWTEEGSPLRTGSEAVAAKLQHKVQGKCVVQLAMRYGRPDIRSGLESLKSAGVDRLVVLPLYPQYSGTTTEAVFDAVSDELRNLDWFPEVESIQKYHDNPLWIKAVADSIREFQSTAGKPDKLIFSMHGIPQRYVNNGDPYALQCEQSVRDISTELGLADDDWMMTFQSRVGREPWLEPYTDETLKKLGASGCEYVQVVCPGFSVDCLETLEEIMMENKEYFLAAGGKSYDYIPALNDHDAHIAVFENLSEGQSPK